MYRETLTRKGRARRMAELYRPGDFARRDEGDDALFYARERMVSHLDSRALGTVSRVIGSLIVEERPAVLDLMASWDSHLPAGLNPARVAGLGLNQTELGANPVLTERVLHDLNQNPRLPFNDAEFDAVINVASVDYLTDPVRVFAEAGRVLKPGGLFLVIFSNRWFEPKVTELWRRSSEGERVCLVQEWLEAAGGFGPFTTFASKGQPRPADDKYAHLGIPSDPVYAVWAERAGGDPVRAPRPFPAADPAAGPAPEVLAARTGRIAETHECPHCGAGLLKWAVPQSPFTEWDNEYMYVCFNDECPYLLRGFEAMSRQGNVGSSYRLMFNPDTGSVGPILVHGLSMLRDGIMAD